MAGEQYWVAGGELGSSDRSAQEFKQIILGILGEGETVTKALKRLKPPPKRTANKRKTRNSVKKSEDKDEAAEDPTEQAARDKQFNSLTDAAGELMSLGFEDIYSDTKADIASNLHSGADQGVSKGGAVWHDDGTVKDEAAKDHSMYQRPESNSALSYQEAAQAASTDHQLTAAETSQIPTPATAAISASDAASLDAATAEVFPADEPSTTHEVGGAQIPAVLAPLTHPDNGAVAQESASPVADGPVDSHQGHMPAVGAAAAPQQPIPAASKSTQPAGPHAEAAAAASHITEAVEAHAAAPGDSASHTAEAADAESQPASNDSSHAVPDTTHKAVAPSTDTHMADGSIDTDTALHAAAVSVQPQPVTASSSAPTSAQPEAARKGPAKGPGLGESREFTGGPMNFERPKYRHTPYGPPPIRAGGRFSPAGGRGSPRGRDSPTGRAFGRGFSEPPRSSIMRPQYRQQPPQHMPPGGFPPPYHAGYAPQPPPPAPHHAHYYPPPPQQAYAPPPQQGYNQQAYPPPPRQAYPPQQYAQPAQYDAQWKQYQDTQGQFAAYQQPSAYPPPAAAPPPG